MNLQTAVDHMPNDTASNSRRLESSTTTTTTTITTTKTTTRPLPEPQILHCFIFSSNNRSRTS